MIDKRPDEMPDVQDDSIEIEASLEEPVNKEGPTCQLNWEDGQVVIVCETLEDAKLVAEVVSIEPVMVRVRTGVEPTKLADVASDRTEESSS